MRRTTRASDVTSHSMCDTVAPCRCTVPYLRSLSMSSNHEGSRHPWRGCPMASPGSSQLAALFSAPNRRPTPLPQSSGQRARTSSSSNKSRGPANVIKNHVKTKQARRVHVSTVGHTSSGAWPLCHAEFSDTCGQCKFTCSQEKWVKEYGAFRHRVQGRPAHVTWLSVRPPRLAGKWGIGCSVCAYLL